MYPLYKISKWAVSKWQEPGPRGTFPGSADLSQASAWLMEGGLKAQSRARSCALLWRRDKIRLHHVETMVCWYLQGESIILHHFETMVCWHLQGNRILPGFLNGGLVDPSHALRLFSL